jgi:hypothetical protein
MLLTKLDKIGEKTINKIAEMAFKSQIKDAQHLSVKVTTEPHKLAKGILESLDINGYGLTIQQNLPLEQMTISLKEIAVNPFQALMGKVQLTQPSYGKADIVLTEQNIATALNINYLNRQLSQVKIILENQPVTTRFSRVDCSIFKDGRVAIKAKLIILDRDSIENISLILQPTICPQGQGIVFAERKYNQGQELSPILTNALTQAAQRIFNLDHFVMEGISLKVNNFTVTEGKINLLAKAGITRLPTS